MLPALLCARLRSVGRADTMWPPSALTDGRQQTMHVSLSFADTAPGDPPRPRAPAPGQHSPTWDATFSLFFNEPPASACASLPILPLEGGALSNEARHGPGVPGLGREAGAGTAELADDTKTVQVAVWSTCSREAGQRTPWTPPGRMVLPLGPSGS